MNLPENIPQIEENIPLLASLAVRQAIEDALLEGRSVTQVKNGQIVERLGNGIERVIKAVDAPVSVESGTVFRLR